ncbi:polysaccharide biosynthesis protein [Aliikangiella coralliicola]|uniref:Polysaccharide biosynthesis protein n=2 Tax=Aliikangiella coralliicola TaxID=2592383 RepID=A0A545TSV8_9GAMM|nr:polysaccharide biosynthesis protein [Aliikangiella coralliicola]
MISSFIEYSRPTKRIVSLAFDFVAIVSSIYLALNISIKDYVASEIGSYFYFAATSLVSLVIFARIGFYRAILRYMGLKAIFTISAGITLSTTAFTLSCLYLEIPITPTSVLLYWSFSLVTIGGARLLAIALIRSTLNLSYTIVAIYGAGSSGRQLARALSQSDKYKIAAYFDDEPTIIGSEIDGVKVYSQISIENIIEKKLVSQVLLAMPSASHARRSEILTHLEPFPIKVKTIASMEEIVSGKVQIEQLKEIEIEDLLGRDSVDPDQTLLHSCITDKVVMVTGSGGSIGSELCRQIIALKPSSLILYELSEFALYSIEKELRRLSAKLEIDVDIKALLGSVQHKNRLIKVMERYSVQTVYHAAAYKHVPIVEHNIVEGIRNNVFGTWYAAEAAAEAKVERFVLVSTDKAVRPTNVMGASKRLAELVLQALNTRGENTVFTMVRFGNVLGSSGSVVPLFREQIRTGGPVTVTHKDIIRYFMTIPEAAQLVIQAGAMGKGGDVFVLDMGDQVRISELAERMIHLMGRSVKNSANPQGDIEIQYSGLRPGEKLYEELLVGENVVGTNHPKIMTANEELLPWGDMQRALILLNELCDGMDCDGIVQMLLKIPTGYNPQHEVCDLLWDSNKDKNNVLRFKTLS